MGRRGPPPKPTVLKVLNGNAGKHRLNSREPQPTVGTPHCPEWLSDPGRKIWRRLVPQLRVMKVLALVDADALAAYCHVYTRWRDAEDFLTKHGMVYPIRDDQGRVKCMVQFPQVAIARNLLVVMRAYQQEFGLTPAARARIVVAGAEEPNTDARRWLG
jgi:P27 family predicted phage terminase small subunit